MKNNKNFKQTSRLFINVIKITNMDYDCKLIKKYVFFVKKKCVGLYYYGKS